MGSSCACLEDDGCHTIWHIPEEVGWCSTVHAHFAWTMTCSEGGCSGRMGVWTEVDAGLDYAWSSGNGAIFVWTEVVVSLLMFNDCLMAMVKYVIFCCLIINLLNLWLSMRRTGYMLNRGLQSLFVQGLQWQYNIALIHLTSQRRHCCSSTELRSLAFTSIAGHHNHRTTLEGAPVGLLLPCTRTAQLVAHKVGLIPKYWQVI